MLKPPYLIRRLQNDETKFVMAASLSDVAARRLHHPKKITCTYVTTDRVPVKVMDRNAQAQLAEAATSVRHSLQQMSAT